MLFDASRTFENEVVYFDNKWTKEKAMYDFRSKEIARIAVLPELEKYSTVRIQSDYQCLHLQDEHFWLMKATHRVFYNYY